PLGRPWHLATAAAAFCVALGIRLRSASPRCPEPGPRPRCLRGCPASLVFTLCPAPPAPAGRLGAGAPCRPRPRLGAAAALHDDVQMACPLADAVGAAQRTGAEPLQRRPLVGFDLL